MRLIIYIFALVFSGNSFSAHIELSKGAENDVCSKLFSIRLIKATSSFREAAKILARKEGIPEWKQRKLSDGYDSLLNDINYAVFDIDNDGVNEYVYSHFTWMSGQPGEVYTVFNTDAIKSKKDLEAQGFYKQAGLNSVSPEFNYREFGVWFAELIPFRHKGTYYVGIKDIYFGKGEFIDRKFFVAKYSNEMIVGNSGYKTSNLENICTFEYVES
ncbi:hypothetical protein [Shewanella woodyi]|uniref:Uncharacterized protein n=1 Tax=Shewanella woodyi (strain ATCC 51908 / MS32) TaxID=392500 RepID=B1KFV1_SHEWM|nr:hypothetical protein [Shewanella woodyi]ACA85267.1 hypothetical protein Swoo_0974 [Shewanella woodyi ATCC 51908]